MSESDAIDVLSIPRHWKQFSYQNHQTGSQWIMRNYFYWLQMVKTTVSGESFMYLNHIFSDLKGKKAKYISDNFIQKRSQCHFWGQLLFFYFWTDHNFSILSITIYNLGLSSYKRKDWVITAATLFWCCIIEFRAEHPTDDKTIKLMRTHLKCTQPFCLAQTFFS